MITAQEFLHKKLGEYNATHPFQETDIDYEDIEKWLSEYAQWWVAAWNLRDKQATDDAQRLNEAVNLLFRIMKPELISNVGIDYEINKFLKQFKSGGGYGHEGNFHEPKS